MTDGQRSDFGPNKNALYSLEAEEGLIGCCLISPEAYYDVADFMSSEYFHLHKHRWVWDTFVTLAREKMAIDLSIICIRLEQRGQLEEIGGAAYLTRLISNMPNSMHVETFANLVRHNAMRRQAIEVASGIARLAYDPDLPEEDLLDGVEGLAATLRDARPIFDLRPISAVMGDLYDQIEAAVEHPEASAGMKTGFPDLDKLFDGALYPGEMTLVCGDPGSGKSILTVQTAAQLAIQGHYGAVFELEMKDIRVARRLLSSVARVPLRLIRDGLLADADLTIVTQAISMLSNLPLYISGESYWTTSSIRAACKRLRRELEMEGIALKFIIVDFLDLLQDDVNTRNPFERDTIIARNLHGIAMDLDLHVLAVHTLNKEGFKETAKKIQNVSGSGKISYATDNLIFIGDHIPEEGASADPTLRTISPGKLRDGEIHGSIDLKKVEGYPMFESVAGPSHIEIGLKQGRLEL
jgi:replicative DNA helicase